MPAVGTAFSVSSSSSSASPKPKCDFCGMTNHVIDKCFQFINAQKIAKENAKKRRGGGANKANKVQENTQSKDTVVAEFAGNASLSSTYDPSNPSNPLQTDADYVKCID